MLTGLLEELQARPHLRPAPGEHAPWYPAHLGGHAPDRREALALDDVPRAAITPTWGPPLPPEQRSRALGWWPSWPAHPKRQRVAAYAVIVRDGAILLSRLSPLVTREQLWTLPGGGLDHGEDPRDAVVREIHEETGLHADVSDTARVYSAHMPQAWRGRPAGQRPRGADRLRGLGGARLAGAAGASRSTARRSRRPGSRWPTSSPASVPVTPLVLEALADHRPFQRQRVAAYALVRRGRRARPAARCC